jgi:L-asparagine oxygenase
MLPPSLQDATVRRLSLPEASKEPWLRDALALSFPEASNPSAWRVFVDASVGLVQRHLPADAAAALAGFFAEDGPDALLIENLPADPALPPAPSDGKRPASKTAVSEAVIAGLIERHAAIVSYSNEKGGAPIHEITPVAGLEHAVASTGRVPFACHTDAAFLAPRFSPRGLLLFGLLNEPAAPTAVLPLDRILEAASPGLVRSLEQSIFRHPSPSSFEVAASVTGPILWRDSRGVARIAVQTHAVQPVNEEARGAIAQLRALLDTLETERVVLGPGDALLFKNDRVLHGRDAFTGARWLQRAYFTDDLAPFRERAGAPQDAFAFDARRLL